MAGFTLEPPVSGKGFALEPPAPAQATDYGSPTDGMSGFEKFAAGNTKSVYDTGRGLTQALVEMLANGGGLPGMSGTAADPYWQQKALELRQQADEQRRLDKPLMDSGAGLAGNVVGNVEQAVALPMRGASAVARLLSAAAGGGIQAAAQPVGVNDSRASNTLVGATLGAATQGVANTLGAITSGPAAAADPARQAAVEFAAEKGIPLTRGQQSGNEFTQRVERMLAALPGSRGFYKNVTAKQGEGVTTAVNDLTGGDAGQLIQKFGDGKTVTLDPDFFDQVRGMAAKFAGIADRDVPNGALKSAEQYVGSQTPNPALGGLPANARAQAIAQGVPEFAGGTPAKYAPGDTLPMTGPYGDFNNYQALRSLYGTRAFKAGDPTDQVAFGELRDAFDGAATRSLEAAGLDPAELAKVRAAYAVEKTLAPARVVSPDGDVSYSGQKVAAAVGKKDAKQASFIDNLPDNIGTQLRRIANFAQQVQPINSSGTSENAVAGKVATGAIIADLLKGEGLKTVAGSVAGLTALPWATNAIMQATRNGVPLLRDVSPEASDAIRRLLLSGVLGSAASLKQ